MYKIFKPFLFKFDPEHAHVVTLDSLQLLHRLKLLRYPRVHNPVTVMGLNFPNPLGVAAGLDKNGEYIDALAKLGFGFIEIGTITPLPQSGNEKPRLFRSIKDEAIINRLGFNNKGMEFAAARLAKTRYKGILGINIGRNRDTPNDKAVKDYLMCFRKLAPYASYITINISSPNTAGLRELQKGYALTDLLRTLKTEQSSYAKYKKKYVPLVVKISPDLPDEELESLANICLAQHIDGIIATNTTIERMASLQDPHFAEEIGGLSGKPLAEQSTRVVRKLKELLQNKIPIIAAGGITDSQSARAKYAAGANLLQMYTGLVYYGPKIIQKIAAVPPKGR